MDIQKFLCQKQPATMGTIVDSSDVILHENKHPILVSSRSNNSDTISKSDTDSQGSNNDRTTFPESRKERKKTRLPSYKNTAATDDDRGGYISEASRTEKIRVVNCPICSKCFPMENNKLLNEHIDSCLNGSVVRTMHKNSFKTRDAPYKNKRLTDFFATSKRGSLCKP